MALSFIRLISHPISEQHNVKNFNGQSQFYTQNWIFKFSPSKDIYQSPIFTDQIQTFNIFFVLSFDKDGIGTIAAHLVEQNSFRSFYFNFEVVNTKGHKIRIYNEDTINFKFIENSNSNDDLNYINDNKNSSKLIKSEITLENGLLNNEGNFNFFFEISSYQNISKRPQPTKVAASKIPGKPGLKNMHSMCYINSFLQVLFHIPIFRHILFSVDTSQTKEKKVLIQTQFLFFMMEISNDVCSAQELANVISFCSSENNSGKQQDAHEFAILFLEELENDLKGTSQENALKNLFYGVFKTIIKFKNINKEVSNDEIFNCIVLPVNNNNKLYDCMCQYTSKLEMEYNDDQYGKQKSESWTKFDKLPPILQVCIQRSYYDENTCRIIKRQVPLSFCSEYDFIQFTGNGDDEYVLYAVLSHKGEGDCGHFCVFIRDLADDDDDNPKWFKYSDSVVNAVSQITAINENFGNDPASNPLMAYLLYYVKRDDIDRLFHVSDEMSPQMKSFMKYLKDEKEREIMEMNYINFKIILEEDLNSKPSIEVDDRSMFLKDKTLRIHNSESTRELYIKVHQLLNKDIHKIRLWAVAKGANNNLNIIVPRKETTLENMENILFVQNKLKEESCAVVRKGSQNSNLIMIFLKYFDVRMKLPIRYMGTITVDKNSGLEVSQINTKLGFPEWTKFYFFKETSPTSADYISLDKTFTSAQMKQGSVLIVQIDCEATALSKLIFNSPITKDDNNNKAEKIKLLKSQITNEDIEESLPDLSKCEAFKGAELLPYPNIDTNNETLQSQNRDAQSIPNDHSQNSSNIPHFNAFEILNDIGTNLLSCYLDSRFNMLRFDIYNYEERSVPRFTLDIPASFKYNDIYRIIKKLNNIDENKGVVVLYKKDSSRNKASFNRILEKFDNQLKNSSIPENKLYYLLDSNVDSLNKQDIYTVQIAPDGYNVTFTKIIIKNKDITPKDLLNAVSEFPNFPHQQININDIDNLRFFDVHESRIYQDLVPNEKLQGGFYPIRICKLIRPEKDEVSIRVFQAVVDDQLGLTFIKDPFYINVKNGMTVSDFKELVCSKVDVGDREEFMKTKLEKMTNDNQRSNGIYWDDQNDQIEGLKTDSVIYVIYNKK